MTLQDLADKNIEEASQSTLTDAQVEEYLALFQYWSVDKESGMLVSNFEFEDFAQTLDVVVAVGSIAEEEGHHPNLYVYDYKNLLIQFKTHEADTITEKDFIMAAKVELIFDPQNIE